MFESPFGPEFTFVALSKAAMDPSYALLPREAELVSDRAAEKRRAEFTLGRAAAAQALQKLGFNPAPPVLRGSGREPVWPKGVIGSITHSEGWAIAVVARKDSARSVGIDLQLLGKERRSDISRYVCTTREAEWLAAQNETVRARLSTALFSAKESVYKAFYPLVQKYLAFKEVELTSVDDGARFGGILLVDLNNDFPAGYRFTVDCKYLEPKTVTERAGVFTYVVIPTPARESSLN
jgi:4'-phosphopantetheinyl transferase EntD